MRIDDFFPGQRDDDRRRLKVIEDYLAHLPSQLYDARLQGVTSTTTPGGSTSTSSGSGGGGGGGSVTLSGDVTGPASATIVERLQLTDLPAPAAGDNNRFIKYVNATPAFAYSTVALAGDVSGTNEAAVVDKAKGVDFPSPGASDDWKVLSYLHGSVDYVLRHPPFKTVSKAVDYTATLDDFVILVDATGAARTITLPTAASATQRGFYIKKVDAVNNVIIDGNGAETIDGAATVTLTVQYESRLVVSDGSTWWIL